MATNTSVRTVIGQLPSDGSTVDLTVSGETRTPTGCVVLCSHATALDTATDHLSVSFGVSDFTTTAQIGVNDEHGIGTSTDAHGVHQETNILEIYTPGTSTVIRSATVSAITGGIRLDAVEASGAQYRVQAIIVFGSVCKAFSSDGDGDLAIDETFNIAHGMTTEPGAGFYGFNVEDLASGADGKLGLGFHSYDGSIKQGSCAWFFDSGVGTTNTRARTQNDRCVSSLNASGDERRGIELTAIDTTNVTYTNRTVANPEKYIGLLIECDDISTDMLFVDSPVTAASDWNYNGLSFQPQFVSMITNRTATIDIQESDADAGVGSFMAMDEDGGIHSTAWASEVGVVLGTTNTSCELSQNLFCPTDTHGNSHLMNNHSFTTDGWDFLAADITAADGTTRKWPMLAFQQAPVGGADFHGSGRGIRRGIARGIG